MEFENINALNLSLRQLRYVVETARRNLNIARAAEALNTSQPGVSKQIKVLEDALNTQIFTRYGRRLISITPKGEQIIEVAERMLRDAQNIQAISEDTKTEQNGSLTIATTDTIARYCLPEVIKAFSQKNPNVQLRLKQNTPNQIVSDVRYGEADFAIYTSDFIDTRGMESVDCFEWNRVLITQPDHPLAAMGPPTLEDIAANPLIGFESTHSSHSIVRKKIESIGLPANFVVTGSSAGMIKTFAKQGLGVGIIPSMAFDPEIDAPLIAKPLDHIFDPSTTKILFKKNRYFKSYEFEFLAAFAPNIPKAAFLPNQNNG